MLLCRHPHPQHGPHHSTSLALLQWLAAAGEGHTTAAAVWGAVNHGPRISSSTWSSSTMAPSLPLAPSARFTAGEAMQTSRPISASGEDDDEDTGSEEYSDDRASDR